MTPMRHVLALVALLSPSALLAEEQLPERALARLGDHRFYHGPGIECAVLSPDGSRAATVARYSEHNTQVTDKERQRYDCTVVLWNTVTGERTGELRSPRGPLSQLVYSGDGKLLAAACGGNRTPGSVVLFEVSSGKLLHHLRDFKDPACLHFSADGKNLRVSEWFGAVTAWDVATGQQVRLWKPPALAAPVKDREKASAVRGFPSPDGKVIVWEMNRTDKEGTDVSEGESLRVHNAETDKLLYQITSNLYRLPLSFSADSKRFAALGGRVQVWETATGKELVSLNVEKISRFGLAPDGKHAVIYEEGSRVRLWDLDAGKVVRDLYPGHLAMRADNLQMPQVFSADGKTLLLDSYTTLRVFDTATGKERSIPGHRSAVTPRFSADGRTLLTTCGETERSWDLSGTVAALLRDRPRKFWEGTKAISADGRFFLERDWQQSRSRVRETETGRVVSVLKDNKLYPDRGLFSPDASRVLLYWATDKKPLKTGETSMYWLCELKAGKMLWEFEPRGLRSDPVFSPDGQLIAWADDNNDIRLHSATSGKSVRTLRSARPLPDGEGHREGPWMLFSPDGAHLMVTSYFFEVRIRPEIAFQYTTMPIRVFHISSGKEVQRFYADPQKTTAGAPLSCSAWSPDGRLLAVAERDSGVIRLIEFASGKVRAELAGHRHGVHGLAFSPDGRTLASGGEDNVVFLWDVPGSWTGPERKTVSERDLPAWWSDLAAEDAKRAGTALAFLLRTPGATVAFLKDRLRPSEPLDQKRVVQLIAELDAASFARREAAQRELAALGPRAEPSLKQALKKAETLETRRRLEGVLKQLEHHVLPGETLQMIRAVEGLEVLATPEARQLLATLAKGASDARQTQEAKASLQRLLQGR